jgi:dihydroorotase
MDILIRSARIIDSGSPFHLLQKDILISNGKIKKIGSKIIPTGKVKEIKLSNLHVSLGWFDLNTFLADPGLEHKETITSGCAAAATGGFTHICAMPNTVPFTQTKSQIEYILRKSADELVEVHPIGAATKDGEGKEIAEMFDLKAAGAVAFSDGNQASSSAGMTERELLYVKAFGGLLMAHAEDKTISKNGVMNESLLSAQLGLPGIPALAEELIVHRNLYLLEYTQSRLHLLNISLKRSAELIRTAKKKKLGLSASVNAYNLFSNEKEVGNYNTQFKLNPPLRTSEDLNALAKALNNGTIDTITSAHQPHEEDCKKLEFDKADFGMIGLETCFALANTALQDKVTTDIIIKALANNPRSILGIKQTIAEGEAADLTLFDPEKEWTFTEKDIRSASKNTPYLGQSFVGKALGVINKGKTHFNF